MRRMYDASTPPSRPPRLEVVAGYIGGDTPHVWTDAEWNAQPARFRLPIYVRSNPGSHDPHTDAAAAIRWLSAHKVPHGCAVTLDLETAVNRPYVRAFDQAVLAAGWRTVKYGSLSTIFHNPRTSGGTWTADWTGSASLDHIGDTVATQYASDTMLGTGYDLSVVADTLLLWDTQPDWSTQIMDSLPTLRKGASGFFVAVLQALLQDVWRGGSDPELTLTRVFDDATEQRVRQEQQEHGLTVDGIVGPQTWNLLLLYKKG